MKSELSLRAPIVNGILQRSMMTKLDKKRARVARGDPKRKLGKRHSLEEKTHLIKVFEEESAKTGKLVASAKLAGPSYSTFRRWARDVEVAEHHKLSEALNTDLSVDDAIATLSSAEGDKNLLLEAVFIFISWLRWPGKPLDQQIARTMCVLSYLRQSTDKLWLDQLSQEDSAFALRNMRMDVLLRLMDGAFPPTFQQFYIDGQPYTESEVLADLVWFLLASANGAAGSRHKGSLNKAFYMQEQGAFKHKWTISHSTFRKFWLEHGGSSPFHYIDRFHPGPNWDLDPYSDTFKEDADRLIGQPEDIRRYFSRCRWAVESLASQLDPRALSRIRFPKFPSNLAIEVLVPAPLTPEMHAKLRDYGQSYKYL